MTEPQLLTSKQREFFENLPRYLVTRQYFIDRRQEREAHKFTTKLKRLLGIKKAPMNKAIEINAVDLLYKFKGNEV